MIRVVLVDDHPVVRTGLALMLHLHEDIDVVAAASDADSGVSTVLELTPDVVLMDLSLGGRDGISATREITARNSRIAVVVLTSFSDAERIQQALDAGAIGYMLKDSEPSELVDAVRAAARGESPLHPKAARIALSRRTATTTGTTGAAEPAEGLTEREREVLRHVANGLTNGQIARRLGIAERTVKGHLTNVYGRLGVTDRTSAAVWAERHLTNGE